MLDLICHEMSLVGYSVTIYRLLPADIAALRVPDGIRPTRTAGIICAELLDRDYCRMAADLGYPIIFVDFPVYTEEDTPDADILLMDNEKCITSFIRQMKESAHVDGFVFGNSGGKDSALVGILCKAACDNTVGIIMPCASKRNYGDRKSVV